MKKTFILLISFILLITITGCSNSPKKVVEEYLNKYNSLDVEVLNDVNNIVDTENLTEEQKETYQQIFKREYADLKYEITNEEYDGDEATITVKITVYDLYKVQNEAVKYLANNPDDFNDEEGSYDVNKYIAYKLDKMVNVTDTVDYTIDFYVVKTKDGWTMSSLSNSDLEKIHGIYNYES